jgi:hypothetical protein
MTDSLAENFKMIFHDFHSHATNIRIFENTFSIEVSDVPGKLILELTNCSMTQFCAAVSTGKLFLLFMLLYQYLSSIT